MGSFEHEYGQRWKHMHELFKQKAEALKREMIMEEEKLEAQMEYARYEHETEQLRERMSNLRLSTSFNLDIRTALQFISNCIDMH